MATPGNVSESASQNNGAANPPSVWATAYGTAVEAYLWIFVAIASLYLSVRGVDLNGSYNRNPIDSILYIIEYASKDTAMFNIGMFSLTFPLIFRMIFGQLPFQFIRSQFRSWLASRQENRQLPTESRAVSYFANLDPRQALCFLAERSNSLAKGIYTRSGVYLLVGVVIAFGGITAIWNRYNSLDINGDMIHNLFVFLPNVGLFIVIEFIAFFFLRQYRSAMDDFRYYDAVARSRHESFVVLKMFQESRDVVSTRDVLTSMQIYSSGGRIMPGETTDIIESRKMQRDELIFVENVAAAVAQYQRDSGGKKEKKDKD